MRRLAEDAIGAVAPGIVRRNRPVTQDNERYETREVIFRQVFTMLERRDVLL